MQTQNTKKKIELIFAVFLFVFVFLPVLTEAVEAPPPTGDTRGTGITYECGSAGTDGKFLYGNCTFQDLVAATKRVTDYGAKFALSFSVVVLAVVGGRYMVYADNAGERKKTHSMLTSVLIGIGFILAAWLMVTLITTSLLNPNIVRFSM